MQANPGGEAKLADETMASDIRRRGVSAPNNLLAQQAPPDLRGHDETWQVKFADEQAAAKDLWLPQAVPAA